MKIPVLIILYCYFLDITFAVYVQIDNVTTTTLFYIAVYI